MVFIMVKLMSLPTWERGLKYHLCHHLCWQASVAPYMGAWIEIYAVAEQLKQLTVAPYMGAWIEIIASKMLAFFN